MDIMVLDTLTELSIVPEVQVFFEEVGGGCTRRIKNVLSLVYYTLFRFVGYWKKYIIYQVKDLKCTYKGQKCILIVVHTHMDYLFPAKIDFFLLSIVNIWLYRLNFEFPVIMTETVPFYIFVKIEQSKSTCLSPRSQPRFYSVSNTF